MQKEEIASAIVTGPTGVVGSALCARLLREGIRVYAVVRPQTKRINALPEGVNVVPCDMEEYELLPKLIGCKVDAFFHLAWGNTIGSGRNDMYAQNANVRYSLDAVRAAIKLKCSVFVGIGSQAEYGRVEDKLTPQTPCFPENGYGMAKLCAGQMTRVACEQAGIRHEWVRILSVYGPNDNSKSVISLVIRKLLRGEKPALTEGEQKWDYLFSEDAADALWRVAKYGKHGAVYPLGGGHACSLRTYIEILRDEIDPMLELGFGEIPYGPYQVMYLEADITALQQDTGFVKMTSFREGIKQTIEQIKRDEHIWTKKAVE